MRWFFFPTALNGGFLKPFSKLLINPKQKVIIKAMCL